MITDSGIDAVTYISFDEGYPKLFLIRSNWKVQDERPRVAIGLEWARSSATFQNSYLGIWADIEAVGGKELESRLQAGLKKNNFLAGKYQSSAWWPAWRYILPARKDYWNDLDEFGREVIEAIKESWTELLSVVEDGLRV
jgi:hypothetical protein